MDLILLVHAFDGPIRNPDLGPGKDTVEVAAQHLREFLEGFQLDRIAELIHLVRCCWARQGCL